MSGRLDSCDTVRVDAIKTEIANNTKRVNMFHLEAETSLPLLMVPCPAVCPVAVQF